MADGMTIKNSQFYRVWRPCPDFRLHVPSGANMRGAWVVVSINQPHFFDRSLFSRVQSGLVQQQQQYFVEKMKCLVIGLALVVLAQALVK